MRLRGMQAMETEMGGWGSLLAERPDLYVPGGQEANLLQSMADMGGPGGYERDPITASLFRMGTGSELEGAYKSLYDLIVGPELANSATLGGLGGRGGSGYGEFATRYLTQLAPTIMNQKADWLSRVPGLQTNIMGNIGAAAQAAGAGRMGRLQDYGNRLNIGTSAFLGMPWTGGGSQESTTRGYTYPSIANNVGQMIGQASQLSSMAGGMMMGMCWIARALYGEYSPRAAVARFKVTMLWPTWLKVAYNTAGWLVAKTPARHLFRAYFDRLVTG